MPGTIEITLNCRFIYKETENDMMFLIFSDVKALHRHFVGRGLRLYSTIEWGVRAVTRHSSGWIWM